MQLLHVKMVGVGRAVPEHIVPSSLYDERFGLDLGTTEARTGVATRSFVSDGQTATDLGLLAAREALDDAGILGRDLDLIVNASGSSVQMIPDGAALLQRAMGLGDSGIPCLSMHSTCLSFLSAVDLVSVAIGAGRYRRVLIVSAEVTSNIVDPEEWHCASLFGDGAAAVILSATPTHGTSAIHGSHAETHGVGAEFARLEGYGTKNAPHMAHARPDMNFFHMDGTKLFKMTTRLAPPFFDRLFQRIGMRQEDIDWIVPHQASEATMRVLGHCGFDARKVIMVLKEFGNCVAASIPMTLYAGVRSGRIERGQRILLCGTGAGFSVQGIVMTY